LRRGAWLLGQSLLERVGTNSSDDLSIVGCRKSIVEQAKVLPRFDELAAVLFAVGQIEERARCGIELVALLELRTRDCVVARLRCHTPLAKERFGILRESERREQDEGEGREPHQCRRS